MGYIAVVLAQTVVLPVVFGLATLASHDTWAIAGTFGRWFLFWGVGSRLVLAGVVQIVKPEFTTESILGGSPQAGANQVAQELGFADLAMGIGGCVGTFLGGGLAAAITGGLYMGIAGMRHVVKRDANVREQVATWTDLLVFATMIAYAAAVIVRGP